MTLRSWTASAGIALAVASFAPDGTVTSSVAAQESAGGSVRLVTRVIDGELASGYQPVVADLNRDGRPDVIGLSTRIGELAWYENPGWERHVLATGLNRSINAAARDLDGDGIPEIALAHEFGTTHASSVGVLSLLTHRGDPTEPWSIREVDRTPTVHRIRWSDRLEDFHVVRGAVDRGVARPAEGDQSAWAYLKAILATKLATFAALDTPPPESGTDDRGDD